jgi:hypothetical protein
MHLVNFLLSFHLESWQSELFPLPIFQIIIVYYTSIQDIEYQMLPLKLSSVSCSSCFYVSYIIKCCNLIFSCIYNVFVFSYIIIVTHCSRSRGSSVSIVSDYGLDNRGLITDRQRIFLLASASRPALGPNQTPVQWVPGVLSLGVKHGWGVTLTTHPHLVLRSRMSRSYTSFPPKCLHGV